jgi:hypothetical protein
MTPPRAGTSLTCQSGQCALTCADPTLPTTCGATCKACTATKPNTKATCVGTPLDCGTDCIDTAHRCTTGTDLISCWLNTDADNCGAECKQCPTFDHATRACVSGNCEFTCADNFHDCRAKDALDPCKANTSNEFCGTACETCDTGKSCQKGELGWACADMATLPIAP